MDGTFLPVPAGIACFGAASKTTIDAGVAGVDGGESSYSVHITSGAWRGGGRDDDGQRSASWNQSKGAPPGRVKSREFRLDHTGAETRRWTSDAYKAALRTGELPDAADFGLLDITELPPRIGDAAPSGHPPAEGIAADPG